MDTSTRAERNRAHRRGLLASLALMLGLVGVLLGGPTVAASDHEPDIPPFITVTGENGPWTEFSGPYGRVYGNGTDGFVVIAGGSIEDVCFDNAPPSLHGEFRQRADGTWDNRTRGGQTTVAYVYETDLDVFAFFGEACGGFFGEGTPLPEAFASGQARVEERSWDLAEPFPPTQVGQFVNWVDGVLTGADGHSYKVRAVADFEGFESGDLDFRKDFVRIHRVGGPPRN